MHKDAFTWKNILTTFERFLSSSTHAPKHTVPRLSIPTLPRDYFFPKVEPTFLCQSYFSFENISSEADSFLFPNQVRELLLPFLPFPSLWLVYYPQSSPLLPPLWAPDPCQFLQVGPCLGPSDPSLVFYIPGLLLPTLTRSISCSGSRFSCQLWLAQSP